MATWTFIVEHGEGNTLVSQVSACSLPSAINIFNQTDAARQQGISLPDKLSAKEWSEADNPVRISGTKNVWYTNTIGRDQQLVLANIVKTQSE